MDYLKIQPIIDLHTCIQGEGSLAGVPHILVRTSGCNLRCAFKGSICDTAYSSWEPEKGKYTLADVVDIIERNPQIRHILITGGEPTLHPELLRDLLTLGHRRCMKVTVETNGTNPSPLPSYTGFDLVSLSPKLSSSIPDDAVWREKHQSLRENIPAIVSWIRSSRKHQLKYVVSSEDDIKEVQDQVQRIALYMIDNGIEDPSLNVYLMPEGDTEEKLAEKRKWLAQRCIDLGYYYTDRLHIIIFGEKREA